MDDQPLFSIVIPVWNRADCIDRCIKSVLAQEFKSYEVIVVDDGSDDESLEIVERYPNRRIKIIRHSVNMGVCAARHTGTAASCGEWIVSLDTDIELLPGALQFLANMAKQTDREVGVIGGCCRTDKGEIWPYKLPPEGPFGFRDFLIWKDSRGPTDFSPARRCQVFEKIQWPTDRRLENQFHFRVAKAWKHWISREVIALAHTNSPNRWTTDTSERARKRKMQMAPLLALDNKEIIDSYGSELKKYAPRLYWDLIVNTSLRYFQAGMVKKGCTYGTKALLLKPWALYLLALMLFGLLGPEKMLRLRTNPFIQWAHKKIQSMILGK